MVIPQAHLNILSVSDLTQSIKMTLEGQFRYVAVQGEISNCKLQTSGHLYFSLKDANAQIAGVMFNADASLLPRLPKDGDQVVLKGTINVYPPSGKYQIVARTMEMAGVGALLLKLEELKIKLKAKGFFEKTRKKALPKFPKKIGVVTSPTGAVIQDILHVLSRRFSGFHLILNPVKVQGDGAAVEIARAIDFFNEHDAVDVMIIGRGGGSIEDLFAFNEEVVAEAIFRSRIPIISAVGHETDHCIADYVADVRAPTPSAAAEMVIAEKAHQLQVFADYKRALQQTVLHLIRHARERLNGFKRHPLIVSPYSFLELKMQRLDDIKIELDRQMKEKIRNLRLRLDSLKKQNESLSPAAKIQHYRERLTIQQKRLNGAFSQIQDNSKRHLNQIILLLQALDPRNLLTKGYSIVFSENNDSIINSVRSLNSGDSIKVLFADGTAHSVVKQIDFKTEPK
jgi:exodeoxyribonuclease VII large subunit